ncbi:hypothetical protein DL765_002680 [Monosporascus sp. GIB2]|nr:hypothetical protein DL765_002680 [Monosporascus sp. GIB2]
MFAFPDAKRVRREELYDSSTDGEDSRDEEVDAALRAKLRAQLSGLLDFSFPPAADTSRGDAPQQQQQRDGAAVGDDDHHQAEREEELAFSFRLFRDEAPSHKVVLEQDEAPPQAGGGAFVVARRPTSYYLADEPSPDAMARFRAAAVSPDHIFRDAGRRRWGLEKPWRVTTITITANTATGAAAGGDELGSGRGVEAGKKKRPGKRRRIILRTREKARREREEAAKQQLVEKELHLKEKKKRLNRERKLKRRAKEREKKLASKDGGDAGSEHSSRATSPES